MGVGQRYPRVFRLNTDLTLNMNHNFDLLAVKPDNQSQTSSSFSPKTPMLLPEAIGLSFPGAHMRILLI